MNASQLVDRPSVALARLHKDFYIKKILTWEEYQAACKDAQERWDKAKEAILRPLYERR